MMNSPVSITTPAAPAPNGHYSQACGFGSLIFTSTQLPIDPNGHIGPDSPVEDQLRQLLANLKTILEAGGSSLDHSLRITIYVSDVAFWPVVDRIYAETLGDHKPARGVLAVSALHLGYAVAGEAIAVRNES